MDSSRRILRGNSSNTRTRGMKKVLEHSQAASLQVDPPSELRQSTSERGEHGERLKCNLSLICSKMEGVVLSTVKSGHLAASTSEEGSIQVIENTNDEQMHENEPISWENVKICEANATSQAELPVASTFVTPQKKKLAEVTDTKHSAEPLNSTGSKTGKKGENPGSVTGNTLSSSIKSAPNDSRKNSKCASSDSAPVSGSSRKRARKGWTTLKQIAEKDDLKRKEKMGNFVIPFFMP